MTDKSLMNRGLYISAAGAVVQMSRTDTIANNLANVDTAGFKKDLAVFRANQSAQVFRTKDTAVSTPLGSMTTAMPIGWLSNGAIHEMNVTNYEEGILKETNNPLDLAIVGDAFFTIETPQGVRYTRNGSFTRSAGGELVTMDGYRVLGQNGPIGIADALEIDVNEEGTVFQDSVPVDTLKLALFPNKTVLNKTGNAFFMSDAVPEQPVQQFAVRQGMLEGSNVSAIKEILNLIEANRAYELNARLIQVNDTILGLAVTNVGRGTSQ